jgi:hypothetical protein
MRNDLISTALELFVPHPSVETWEKAVEIITTEFKDALSDINVSWRGSPYASVLGSVLGFMTFGLRDYVNSALSTFPGTRKLDEKWQRFFTFSVYLCQFKSSCFSPESNI